MFRLRTMLGTLAVVVACSVRLAGQATAEGSWTSYFSKVFPGKDTRSTNDRNLDGANTYTKYRLCDFDSGVEPVEYIRMQLTYENTWTPDENMGRVNYDCAGSTWMQYNYGRLKAGWYHSTLINVNGETRDEYLEPLNVGTSSSRGVAFNY